MKAPRPSRLTETKPHRSTSLVSNDTEITTRISQNDSSIESAVAEDIRESLDSARQNILDYIIELGQSEGVENPSMFDMIE